MKGATPKSTQNIVLNVNFIESKVDAIYRKLSTCQLEEVQCDVARVVMHHELTHYFRFSYSGRTGVCLALEGVVAIRASIGLEIMWSQEPVALSCCIRRVFGSRSSLESPPSFPPLLTLSRFSASLFMRSEQGWREENLTTFHQVIRGQLSWERLGWPQGATNISTSAKGATSALRLVCTLR